MRATAKIAATAITGFLGAGETTIVRHILENVRGRPMRLVVQGVGRRFCQGFDRPWPVDAERIGHVVVIGRADLDRTAIAAASGCVKA